MAYDSEPRIIDVQNRSKWTEFGKKSRVRRLMKDILDDYFDPFLNF